MRERERERDEKQKEEEVEEEIRSETRSAMKTRQESVGPLMEKIVMLESNNFQSDQERDQRQIVLY